MAMPKIKLASGGERAQYLPHKSNDTTIRFVLNYPGTVDPDILRAAVKAVVDSVDVLHGTYFVDANTGYWRINEEYDENNYFRYIRCQGDPSIVACSLSVLPVYHEDKVQLRCELVQSDCASSVVVLISHLVCDGGDGKYLLSKLVEAYNLIAETGSADALEVKDGSRAPEQVYENVEWKDAKNLFKMSAAKATSSYPFPSEDPGMCRMVSSVIPAEAMDAARKKAKEGNATANDLLLAACYQVYSRFPEVDDSAPVSISSMMDLRKYCKDGESEGLTNMSSGLPTALEEGVPEQFRDTLAQISRQTNAFKEDPLAGLGGLPILHGIARGIPVWLQMKVLGGMYGNMPVGLTNLGNLKCADHALGNLVPTGGVFGGPLKKKPGMQVSIMSFDGECVLACYGQYTAEDAAHIQATLDAMAKEIAEYAAE